MTEDLIKKVSTDEFAEVTKEGLSLVDFFAEWCGPCRMQVPLLQEFASKMSEKLRVLKVDIDDSQQLAVDFQVTSVPTLILFKDGKEVNRAIGLKDADGLDEFVSNHL